LYYKKCTTIQQASTTTTEILGKGQQQSERQPRGARKVRKVESQGTSFGYVALALLKGVPPTHGHARTSHSIYGAAAANEFFSSILSSFIPLPFPLRHGRSKATLPRPPIKHNQA